MENKKLNEGNPWECFKRHFRIIKVSKYKMYKEIIGVVKILFYYCSICRKWKYITVPNSIIVNKDCSISILDGVFFQFWNINELGELEYLPDKKKLK